LDDVDSPNEIGVSFGADAESPQQFHRATELQRFPGNAAGLRVRDLSLIGVDAPFEIDGSTTQQFIPLWPLRPQDAPISYYCAGWDLKNQLQTVDLEAVAQEQTDGGELIWWNAVDADYPNLGTLLRPDDSGCGCFFQRQDSVFLTAVHEGTLSLDQEAYSLSTADEAVHEWVDRVLFEIQPDTMLDFGGKAGVCSNQPNQVDLFARRSDGSLGHYRRNSSGTDWRSISTTWLEAESLDAPPPGLSEERPGVVCGADGMIDIVAAGADGTLWWHHHPPGGSTWRSAWQRVTDASTLVTSGVSMVGEIGGDFHVFARGANSELRHAWYDNGWLGLWDVPANIYLDGTPVARMGTSTWIDVTLASKGGEIWDVDALSSGTADLQFRTTGDLAISSWALNRIDRFVRDDHDHLMRFGYEYYSNPWVIDTGLVMPSGDLTAVAREHGNVDLFVSAAGSPLWHAVWPRLPRSN
jgi:hypothetical protein